MRSEKKYVAGVLAVLMLLLPLSGCAQPQPLSRTAALLDTVVTVTLYDAQSEPLLDECVALIEQREALWSRTVDTSDIARLNKAAGQPVTVDAATASLLSVGQLYGSLTDGAFDMTVAPLTDLWEDATKTGVVPSAEALTAAAAHVNSAAVQIVGQTVTLTDGEAAVDLGGIAKGQIADDLAALLKARGCKSALLDLGGNIYALGSKPDGKPFQVGIADPRDDSVVIATVPVSDGSVVTSGSYERQYRIGEQAYSHILDPKTGQPIENDLLSVTILSPQSVDGDALSTACFVRGYEQARALVDSYPDIEAVFVMADGSVVTTAGVTLA